MLPCLAFLGTILAVRDVLGTNAQGAKTLDTARTVVDPDAGGPATQVLVAVLSYRLLQTGPLGDVTPGPTTVVILGGLDPLVAGAKVEETGGRPDGADVPCGGTTIRLATPRRAPVTPTVLETTLPSQVAAGAPVADGTDAVRTEMGVGVQVGLQVLTVATVAPVEKMDDGRGALACPDKNS